MADWSRPISRTHHKSHLQGDPQLPRPTEPHYHNSWVYSHFHNIYCNPMYMLICSIWNGINDCNNHNDRWSSFHDCGNGRTCISYWWDVQLCVSILILQGGNNWRITVYTHWWWAYPSALLRRLHTCIWFTRVNCGAWGSLYGFHFLHYNNNCIHTLVMIYILCTWFLYQGLIGVVP